MLKSGIDQQALIDQFASATAKQAEQLREQVAKATLAALQGRELTLKNIRSVLKSVAQAASAGAAQNTAAGVDMEALLDRAVAGMDDALLQAVEANRRALQQFVDQGADLRERHLKKAVQDLEKMEDAFLESIKKAGDAAGASFGGQWGAVLEKMQASGSASGKQAAATAESFATQMKTAVRESRQLGFKAAATMAESYAALASGVLIGMSQAISGGAAPATKTARKTSR